MELSSAWDARIEFLNGGQTRRVWLLCGREPVVYSEVLTLWRRDESFRTFFESLLIAAPFDAYLWETPPVSNATAHRPFEFVQVDHPQLAAAAPEPAAFAEHFENADANGIATFQNLGRDALLVAPRPADPASMYPHLAAFLSTGSVEQRHALWQAVGTALATQLQDQSTWLSTSGLGVAWLHVRLDSRPKYYNFAPYREAR